MCGKAIIEARDKGAAASDLYGETNRKSCFRLAGAQEKKATDVPVAFSQYLVRIPS